MQSRDIRVVIAIIILALTLLGIQRFGAMRQLHYDADAVTIRSVEANDRGRVRIEYHTRAETLYFCPGANSDIQPDYVDIRFVRAWYKKRPEVMYPAQKTSAQNSIRRFVVIEAEDKPVYLVSGKKRIKLFPKD
jgi:hypothetical protein